LLPDQLFRLDGKVAVITGSTRGIGLAAARLMAMAGARSVISSRKPESCESVRAELAAGGFEVIAVPCHVGRDEDRRRLIDETMRVYGQIDVLIANAAVNPVFTPLQNLGEDVWEKVLETNLTSPWRLAQMALPLIADRPAGGSMILVSSIASLVGVPNSGAYAISKAAENHLARQLALEWGHPHRHDPQPNRRPRCVGARHRIDRAAPDCRGHGCSGADSIPGFRGGAAHHRASAHRRWRPNLERRPSLNVFHHPAQSEKPRHAI
jgi:NADP-dependent 3-hydroxy acid dehydrogenase YdfG